MKRHLITFSFLAVAIGLYAAGAAPHATFLLLLAVLAETVFWIRLFRKDKRIAKE